MWVTSILCGALLAAASVSASDSASASASTADERSLTTLLAQTAAQSAGTEVVTSADVRQLLALEGDRQFAGCDEGSDACVAEIAAALGAELVVRGELGRLDDERTLALTVLNTKRLGGTTRALLRARNTAGFADAISAELPQLIQQARGAAATTRVLIVDVDGDDGGGSGEGVAVDDGVLPWQVPVGGVGVAVGAAGLVAAGVCEVLALQLQQRLDATGAARVDQPTAVELGQQRSAWALGAQAGWIVGGAVAATGAAVLLWGVVSE